MTARFKDHRDVTLIVLLYKYVFQKFARHSSWLPLSPRKRGKNIPNWIEPRTQPVTTVATAGCCTQLGRRSYFTLRSNEMLLTFICECKTVIFHDTERPADATGCTLLGSKLQRQTGGLSWALTNRAFSWKAHRGERLQAGRKVQALPKEVHKQLWMSPTGSSRKYEVTLVTGSAVAEGLTVAGSGRGTVTVFSLILLT